MGLRHMFQRMVKFGMHKGVPKEVIGEKYLGKIDDGVQDLVKQTRKKDKPDAEVLKKISEQIRREK